MVLGTFLEGKLPMLVVAVVAAPLDPYQVPFLSVKLIDDGSVGLFISWFGPDFSVMNALFSVVLR
jgi:hypothetical protein